MKDKLFKIFIGDSKKGKAIRAGALALAITGVTVFRLTGFSLAATTNDVLRSNDEFVFLDPTNPNAVCDSSNYWTPYNANSSCFRFFVLNDSDTKEDSNGKYRELVLDHDIGYGSYDYAIQRLFQIEDLWKTNSLGKILQVGLMSYDNATKAVCGFNKDDYSLELNNCEESNNGYTNSNNYVNSLTVNSKIYYGNNDNLGILDNFYLDYNNSNNGYKSFTNNGYWTGQSDEGKFSYIDVDGNLLTTTDSSLKHGIRPVIKVNRTLKADSKSNLTKKVSVTSDDSIPETNAHQAMNEIIYYDSEDSSAYSMDDGYCSAFEIIDTEKKVYKNVKKYSSYSNDFSTDLYLNDSLLFSDIENDSNLTSSKNKDYYYIKNNTIYNQNDQTWNSPLSSHLLAYDDYNEKLFVLTDNSTVAYLDLSKDSSTVTIEKGFQVVSNGNINTIEYYNGYLYVLSEGILYRYNVKIDSEDYGKIESIWNLSFSLSKFSNSNFDVVDIQVMDGNIYFGLKNYVSKTSDGNSLNGISRSFLILKKSLSELKMDNPKIIAPTISYEYTNEDAKVIATNGRDDISSEDFIQTNDKKIISKTYTSESENVNKAHNVVFYDRYGNASESVSIKPELRNIKVEAKREINVGQATNNTLKITASKVGTTSTVATYNTSTVKYTSTNEEYVKVNEKGVVTGLKNTADAPEEVKVIVEAEDDGKNASLKGKYISECVINVTTIPTDYTISPITDVLQPNESVSLNISVTPDNSSYKEISSASVSGYGSMIAIPTCIDGSNDISTCDKKIYDYYYKADTKIATTSTITTKINYNDYSKTTPASTLTKTYKITKKDYINSLSINNVGDEREGQSYNYIYKLDNVEDSLKLNILLNGKTDYSTIAHPVYTITSSNPTVISVDGDKIINNGPVGSNNSSIITVTADTRYTKYAVITNDEIGEDGTPGITLVKKIYVIAGSGGSTITHVTGITATPTSVELYPGDKQTITATVEPENATNKEIIWSSNDENVAIVSNGVITAVGKGTCIVTAETKDGNKKVNINVKVNKAIVHVNKVTLNKTTVNPLYIGKTENLIATIDPSDADNTTLTWTSSDPAVVSVENGVIKGLKAGTATITVKSNDNENATATCKVTVTAKPVESVTISGLANIKVGQTTKLVATVEPSDATNKSITWSTSDKSIVTVESDGTIKGIKAGTANITATSSNSIKANLEIIVSDDSTPDPVLPTKLTLDVTSLELTIKNSRVINATIAPTNVTNKTITWTSSNTNVATVDANGKVTAIRTGNSTITATTVNGLKAECNITVIEDSIPVTKVTIPDQFRKLKLKENEVVDLYAVITPANATNPNIEWTSSDSTIVKVDKTKITALKPGKVTIKATAVSGGAFDNVVVEVVKPVSVSFNNDNGNKEVPSLPNKTYYPDDDLVLPKDDGTVKRNQAKLIGWSTKEYSPLEHRLETINGGFYSLGATIKVPSDDFTLYALYCLDIDNNNVCDYDDNNEPSIEDDPLSPLNLSSDTVDDNIENPQTGVYLYIFESLVVISIATIIFILNRKYDLFKYNK